MAVGGMNGDSFPGGEFADERYMDRSVRAYHIAFTRITLSI